MPLDKRKTVRRLRRLAKTHTQASAARVLGVSRQIVHKLAQKYCIRFSSRRTTPKPPTCRRCAFRKNGASRCLRCKWTPTRVRRLRERYGLSQIKMSMEVVGMNVWAVHRWENGVTAPSPRALEKLEAAEALAEMEEES